MAKDSTIDVAIGFATGRRNFLKVLKTYIYNWKESGLTDIERVRLHLLIAYDLKYNNAKPTDFTRISASMAEKVDSIQFVDAGYVREESRSLTKNGVISDQEAELFFTSGYAAMRNAVLYAAVQRGMDYLLFLDDDEYPLAVSKSRDVALWSGQHVLASHLRYIRGADVTNGYHCGYISPIPYIAFNDRLTEADFRMFIEAISNDILNWDNIVRVMRQGGVTYADTETLVRNEAVEVPEINRCKFISGANLCLNLTHPEKLKPFYNPPGARGEDTFLSTCLSGHRVLRIPTYAFHNGFSAYNYLLSGVLPTELKPITADSRHVVGRFYNACIGWVRYKPLLLYITQRDRYEEKIADMRRKLTLSLPRICAYFGTKEFQKVMVEFTRYSNDVEKHYAQFLENQRVWDKLKDHLAGQGPKA